MRIALLILSLMVLICAAWHLHLTFKTNKKDVVSEKKLRKLQVIEVNDIGNVRLVRKEERSGNAE